MSKMIKFRPGECMTLDNDWRLADFSASHQLWSCITRGTFFLALVTVHAIDSKRIYSYSMWRVNVSTSYPHLNPAPHRDTIASFSIKSETSREGENNQMIDDDIHFPLDNDGLYFFDCTGLLFQPMGGLVCREAELTNSTLFTMVRQSISTLDSAIVDLIAPGSHCFTLFFRAMTMETKATFIVNFQRSILGAWIVSLDLTSEKDLCLNKR